MNIDLVEFVLRRPQPSHFGVCSSYKSGNVSNINQKNVQYFPEYIRLPPFGTTSSDHDPLFGERLSFRQIGFDDAPWVGVVLRLMDDDPQIFELIQNFRGAVVPNFEFRNQRRR